MPPVHVTWPSSLRRAFTQALVLSLLPLATAFAEPTLAQPNCFVRVIRDGADIRSHERHGELRMKAPRGTVLEVILIEGDRFRHRDSNSYWVLLPQDLLGTRPAGWIDGDAVEHVPPAEPVQASQASLAEAPKVQQARSEPSEIAVPKPAPVEEIRAGRPVISDVVLNFEFGKSELTDEARGKLASAVTMPKATQGLSIALEGHADWTGGETYNEKLGLARAETVKRYLAEHLQIPAHRISVVSYGENNPAASNTTREGRARNRRVVIKLGA
jgi:OOP family OmpA-OmpF porin